MTLDAFIERKDLRNHWIHEKYIQVYVRRSSRFIDNKPTPCLDIGSVEVDEEYRGCGIFKAFLSQFEQEAAKMNRAVFVESILSENFKKFFLANGYKIHPHSGPMAPSVYKFPLDK
jgi:GNAT superfamily N-acetyltransferase